MILDWTQLAGPFAVGAVMGACYFAGLWWTVKKFESAERKWSLLLASAAVRLVAAMGVFYWVLGEHWERLVACLAGFVLARAVIVRKLKVDPGGTMNRLKEHPANS